ncbi:MAG TPA: hypothetical protein PLD47_11185 [Aggregatilineales bacterium]|nr:hypothetical protein [Anaerolineales bacterium]HRE48280.1 hypothetical protein [Aggregatilineales bacterium]
MSRQKRHLRGSNAHFPLLFENDLPDRRMVTVRVNEGNDNPSYWKNLPFF